MKTILAKVVTNKMTKTVVVERTLTRAHPLYRKLMRRTQRLKAHTDLELTVGDMVNIVSTRPISKDVHYKVVEKVSSS